MKVNNVLCYLLWWKWARVTQLMVMSLEGLQQKKNKNKKIHAQDLKLKGRVVMSFFFLPVPCSHLS